MKISEYYNGGEYAGQHGQCQCRYKKMYMMVMETWEGDKRDAGKCRFRFLDDHNGVDASWKIWQI